MNKSFNNYDILIHVRSYLRYLIERVDTTKVSREYDRNFSFLLVNVSLDYFDDRNVSLWCVSHDMLSLLLLLLLLLD